MTTGLHTRSVPTSTGFGESQTNNEIDGSDHRELDQTQKSTCNSSGIEKSDRHVKFSLIVKGPMYGKLQSVPIQNSTLSGGRTVFRVKTNRDWKFNWRGIGDQFRKAGRCVSSALTCSCLSAAFRNRQSTGTEDKTSQPFQSDTPRSIRSLSFSDQDQETDSDNQYKPGSSNANNNESQLQSRPNTEVSSGKQTTWQSFKFGLADVRSNIGDSLSRLKSRFNSAFPGPQVSTPGSWKYSDIDSQSDEDNDLGIPDPRKMVHLDTRTIQSKFVKNHDDKENVMWGYQAPATRGGPDVSRINMDESDDESDNSQVNHDQLMNIDVMNEDETEHNRHDQVGDQIEIESLQDRESDAYWSNSNHRKMKKDDFTDAIEAGMNQCIGKFEDSYKKKSLNEMKFDDFVKTAAPHDVLTLMRHFARSTNPTERDLSRDNLEKTYYSDFRYGHVQVRLDWTFDIS